ncbi:carboxypeptidase B-like [Artemia franciscana]
MMREMVENYAAHPEVVDNVDWYFMPLINPDGYEFSRTDNRMWRKTRSTTSIAGCYGADPNRNWDFHWAEGGTSSYPCSEIYTGPVPFSEIEMANVRDAILARASQLRIYLTVHSYGQMLLIPWGYDAVYPEDYPELEELGLAATDALTAVYNTKYDVGCSGVIYGPAVGASDDWNKGVAGIKYSYTLELPDNGRYGFLLPATEIMPVAVETWEFFKVLAERISAN